MSLLAEIYKSLPPITKGYTTICVVATAAFHLGLYHPGHNALVYQLVLSDFQVWRLLINFFFLGQFSTHFAIRLMMIGKYGMQLEQGIFRKQTADFLWMMIFGALSLLALSAIPIFRSPYLGNSLAFMLLYVWSREFPNAKIYVFWLAKYKAFYLPWAMLALDVIAGSPIVPDLLGIIAGHLYYFLTVLHPLAGGRNMLTTPTSEHGYAHVIIARFLLLFACCVAKIVCRITRIAFLSLGFLRNCGSHKLVAYWRLAYWRLGYPTNSHVQQDRASGVFRQRSCRLNSYSRQGFFRRL